MIKRNPIIKRNIEIWKPVEGFPDYEISNMGRIKALTRFVKSTDGQNRLVTEKVLKPGKHFGGPKPTPKHECNHIDGIKENNWDTNLEWLTHKQNMQHAFDTGLGTQGARHKSAKLTEKEVKQIRKLYKTGKKFCVSYRTIGNIVNYKSWKPI